MSDPEVEAIASELDTAERPEIVIDLMARSITTPSGWQLKFTIDEERRTALLSGLDDIGRTLLLEDEIRAFADRTKTLKPWIHTLD